MTRCDTAPAAIRTRAGFGPLENGNPADIDSPGEGSVLQGLFWAAVLYALIGVGTRAAWRAVG